MENMESGNQANPKRDFSPFEKSIENIEKEIPDSVLDRNMFLLDNTFKSN